jgi:hypothetical protein
MLTMTNPYNWDASTDWLVILRNNHPTNAAIADKIKMNPMAGKTKNANTSNVAFIHFSLITAIFGIGRIG